MPLRSNFVLCKMSGTDEQAVTALYNGILHSKLPPHPATHTPLRRAESPRRGWSEGGQAEKPAPFCETQEQTKLWG